MNRLLLSSVRNRVFSLVLLALFPAFALIFHKASEEARQASTEAQTSVLRLARLAAESHETTISEARQLLDLLSRLPFTLDPSACKSFLASPPTLSLKFNGFTVVDLNGEIKCSSMPIPKGVNSADRPWFKEVLRTRTFVVSGYAIGQITQKPVVVFALPLLDDSGELRAVVGTSLDLRWLNHLSQTARLPNGSVIAVIDGKGTILGRQPEPENWVGKSYSEAPIVKTILTLKREGTVETTGADGVTRLYGFTPLGRRESIQGLYLYIGIPTETAYRNAQALLKRNLILTFVVILLAALITWTATNSLILKRTRALVTASKRLATGDLAARTRMAHGPDELGQLVAAFDQMAEALQTRDAEKRVAETTRAQLAAIVESSSDAIIGRTLDGIISSWNKGAETLFGYSSDEMIGRSMAVLIPADQIDEVGQNFDRIKRGEHIVSYETVRLRKGGEPIHVSVTVSVVTDESGKIIGASSITRDISERKRAEDDLRKQNEILQNVFDHIPVLINFIGEDGRIKLVNREWERTLGWTLEEIQSQKLDIFAECYPDPEYRQKVLAFIAAAPTEWEDFQTRVRDGRVIDTAWAETKLSDGTVIGIGMDITERKRKENEMKALHDTNLAITSTLDLSEILRILLEKIDILLPYSASHIRLLNKATGRIEPVACRNIDEARWKAATQEKQGSIHRIISTTKRPLTIRDVRQGEDISRGEFYRDQGFVSYLGVPLIRKEEVVGVLSLFTKEDHDFTQREIEFAEMLAKQVSIAIHNSQLYRESQTLSEELAANEKQVRALANGLIRARDEEAKRIAGVLHDESGQLLASVYITLDEMAKGMPASATVRLQKAKTLLDQVEERLRTLSHELHPTIVDDFGLLPSLEFLTRQISKRTGIKMKTDALINGRLPPLLELTIYRVVQQALNNVARHAHATKVRIRLLDDERLVQCSIQDNGVGFNVKAALSRSEKTRTGLGLYGMRERVEGLGGVFQILSAPGSGTKLLIMIPQERVDESQSIAR